MDPYGKYNFILLLLIICIQFSFGQSSVFTDLKKDRVRAKENYDNGNYPEALSILLELEKNNDQDPELYLLLARTYQNLHDPVKAVQYYSKYEKTTSTITDSLLLQLADAYMQGGYYNEALAKYNDYLESHPEDVNIQSRIWRIKNIDYLLEDSIYYEIKSLPINTKAYESGATFHKNGIVFLSDRFNYGGIKLLDPSTHRPFIKWYYSPFRKDTANGKTDSAEIEEFATGLESKFNKGNLCFYNEYKKMVFIKNTTDPSDKGLLPLQMFFAAYHDGTWLLEASYEHNDKNYSIVQPSMDEKGELLFFASDMPGGYGGMDLYYSEKNEDGWSAPVNAGKKINTPQNEGHPFMHKNTLYFSSDGHGGMGGLDIFKVFIDDSYYQEIENPGYPVNSNFDDFGLVLDESGHTGYLTSNRNTKGNDDIYAIRIHLQSYPIMIEGSVKLQDISSTRDSLKLLSDAELYLIDKRRNIPVFHTKTNEKGTFTANIPYHSQYQLKIMNEKLGTAIVSFEIPRQRHQNRVFNIVVVKELFQFNVD